MTESLRALATAQGAEQERRARALAEALEARTRAERAWQDAVEREREARAAIADVDRGTTAADRELSDRRRARLRDRAALAAQVVRTALSARDRATEAVEKARAALGTAHGERKLVASALERSDAAARQTRSRRDDDEEQG